MLRRCNQQPAACVIALIARTQAPMLVAALAMGTVFFTNMTNSEWANATPIFDLSPVY